MRNISRDDIIQNKDILSSSDDEDLFSKPELNILKYHSRAQSSRRFK